MKKVFIIVISVLSSLVAQAQIDLESKIIGQWQFDGSAIGTNNDLNGTIVNPKGSADRFGREGKALLFNGTSDYVRFNKPVLPTDGSDWTLSLWFNSSNPGAIKHDVLFAQYGYNSAGSDNRFHVFVMNNEIWVFHGSFSEPLSLGAVSSGDWSNIQITVKSQKMSVYRDGELMGSDITISGIQNINSDMGYLNTSSAEYFSGSIDNMTIFSRSLTLIELKYLQYETPKVCTEVVKEIITIQSTVPSNVPIDGLIGWWPFNGDATDMSGNSNNGKITGATLTADRFNKENSAYSFENGGKSIDVGSNDILKVESFSIGAWINLNRFPTTQETAGGILSEGGNGDGNGTDANFTLSIHNYTPWGEGPAVYFGFETETGDNIFISHKLENSFLKTWNHLLGTYDSKNGNLYLYINGVLTDSLKGVTKLPYKSDYPALIGGGIVNASNQVEFFLDASIDDVALWGRALTQQEAISVWGNVLVKVYDTVKVQEIVKVDIYDTIKVFDTVKVTVTDTLYMKFVATTTSETAKESLVKIYPNPAKTDIQFSFSSELVSVGNAIEISTMSGITVFASDINASLIQCNVTEIGGAGSYVVSIKDSSGKVLSSSNLQIVE